MKLRFLLVPALAFATLALADRTDIWSASSVHVTRGHLVELGDGGCGVAAEATFTKQDGGRTHESTQLVEVSGLNRTTCLGLLNPNDAGGFPLLFKNDKNL